MPYIENVIWEERHEAEDAKPVSEGASQSSFTHSNLGFPHSLKGFTGFAESSNKGINDKGNVTDADYPSHEEVKAGSVNLRQAKRENGRLK